MGGGGGERLYTYRYTVTTRMTCIKMGSDESHFNVSLIVRAKSQDSVHRPQLLNGKESRSGFEPRSLCLPAYRFTARPNRLTGAHDGHFDFHTAQVHGVPAPKIISTCTWTKDYKYMYLDQRL